MKSVKATKITKISEPAAQLPIEKKVPKALDRSICNFQKNAFGTVVFYFVVTRTCIGDDWGTTMDILGMNSKGFLALSKELFKDVT